MSKRVFLLAIESEMGTDKGEIGRMNDWMRENAKLDLTAVHGVQAGLPGTREHVTSRRIGAENRRDQRC